MGQIQTVFLPPWEPTTEGEKEKPDEFRTAIQSLSNHSANFLNPHSVHTEPDFVFDWCEHRTFAEAAYTGDAKLGRLIPRLVPKQCAPLPLAPLPLAPHCPLVPRSCALLRTVYLRRTSGATISRTSLPSSDHLHRRPWQCRTVR